MIANKLGNMPEKLYVGCEMCIWKICVQRVLEGMAQKSSRWGDR